MVADVMLSPERRRSPAIAVPRSQVLLLEGVHDGDALPRYGDIIATNSVHAVSREGGSAASVLFYPPTGSTSLAAWSRLREQFDTSCLGLIAGPGSGLADACRILAGCLVDGAGPGGIVLLGFSRDLVATCRSLASDLHAAGRSGAHGATVRGFALASLFEWPPMMIFLPEDDPSIGECAGACRALRSLGVPIRLEIMRCMRDVTGGRADAAEELVREIDRFFAEHLTPHVPRLF